jgi:membrane protease YdiL (CAAX protease family)
VPRVWHLAPLFLLSETVPILLTVVAVVPLMYADAFGPGRELSLDHLRELVRLPSVTLLSMAFVAIVCLALALTVGSGSSQPAVKRLRLGPGLFSLREIFVASVGGLALSSTMGNFLRLLPGYQAGGLGRFHELCAGFDGVQLFAAFVVIGLLAPLGEELFYRGTMQTRLMERFGTRGGIVLTSLVFGAAHLDPMHIMVGFGMGLYLGWISVVAGSVRTTIGVHALNNTFAVLASVAGGASPAVAATRQPSDFVVSGLVSMLVAMACMRWLGRRNAARESRLRLRQADFASHVTSP